MLDLFFAFLMSAAIAVAFRGPLRAVLASGLTGVVGFGTYQVVLRYHGPELLAVFVGALAIGFAGELLARTLREPTLLFVIPGLFPLAPGLIAYSGMLSLARGNVQDAGKQLTRAMFWAGALAVGLALAPALFRRNRRNG